MKLTPTLFFEVLAIHQSIQLGLFSGRRFKSLYELNLKINNASNRNSTTSRALRWAIDNNVLVMKDNYIVEDTIKLTSILHDTQYYELIKMNQDLLEPKIIETI